MGAEEFARVFVESSAEGSPTDGGKSDALVSVRLVPVGRAAARKPTRKHHTNVTRGGSIGDVIEPSSRLDQE